MGRRREALLAVAAAACAAACGLPLGGSASPARAANVPQAGSTATTTCRFAPKSASTACTQETVRTSEGACSDPGRRLLFQEHVNSSRTYRGDVALRRGTVPGGYADAVRADSILVYDSGPHAYGTGLSVEDPSCP